MQNTDQSDKVFKKLTISSHLVRLAEFKARTLGLNFQEYIKHLITEDIQDILSKFKFLKEDEIEVLNDALDEVKSGVRGAAVRRKELETLIQKWKLDSPSKKPKNNQ